MYLNIYINIPIYLTENSMPSDLIKNGLLIYHIYQQKKVFVIYAFHSGSKHIHIPSEKRSPPTTPTRIEIKVCFFIFDYLQISIYFLTIIADAVKLSPTPTNIATRTFRIILNVFFIFSPLLFSL